MNIYRIVNGCHEWMGGRNSKNGYGRTTVNGKRDYMHRIKWAEKNGPIPPGMHVLHKCDNPPCCNPDHLFLGTHLDNVADRCRKGRTRTGVCRGETHKLAKLTPEKIGQAKEMERSGMKQRDIAAAFGVNQATLWRAIRGKSWSHLTNA